MDKTTGSDDAMPLLGDDWFDPLEAGVRQQIRCVLGMLSSLEVKVL
jgi:hypothetical protein